MILLRYIKIIRNVILFAFAVIGLIYLISLLLPKASVLSSEAKNSINIYNVYSNYEKLVQIGYTKEITKDYIELSKPLVLSESTFGGSSYIRIYPNKENVDATFDVLEYSNHTTESVISEKDRKKTLVYLNRAEIRSQAVQITLREDTPDQNSSLLSDELISIMQAVQ